MPINGHVALPENMPTPYNVVIGNRFTDEMEKTFIVGVDKSKIVNQFLKFSWWDYSDLHYYRDLQIGSRASTITLITGKVKTSRLKGTSLKQGPARVESDEKIQWGTLNEQAKWEGGVIEFDVERQDIVYRRYEKGVKVKDSFRKFDGFKWSKP